MEAGNRSIFLFRSSSQEIKQIKTKTKDYENYQESTRLINKMIINVRALLYRTKLIKEQIEGTNDQQGVAALQLNMEEYKLFQKSLQCPFFMASQLDQNMAAAFVLRLCREMSYWASFLYFVVFLVEQIEDLFIGQKNKRQQNIELIYFLCIKKINNKAEQLLKIMHQERLAALSSVSSGQESPLFEDQVLLDPIEQLAIQREKNITKTKEMEYFMNKMINKIYGGLQVVSFEPIRLYKAELSQEFNLNSVLQKQSKRNKKFERQILYFNEQYSAYKKKKMNKISSYSKLQNKDAKLTRPSSIIIKKSLKSPASVKDLAAKEARESNFKFPVLGPSKLHNQRSTPASKAVGRSNSRGPILLSASKQKSKVAKCQKKENILPPKNKILKL